MSEWQPIETAPRDGTWVLLTGGTTSEHFYLEDTPPACVKRPVTAFWEQPQDNGWDTGGGWSFDFWDGAWRSSYETPTHWMPLPSPPKDTP